MEGSTLLRQAEPDPRRHLVLACFCFHSFIQCFCFMDFSTDEKLSNEALSVAEDSATSELLNGLLYYGGFAATLPAMWISLWLLLTNRDWTAGFLMSMLIVLGAWLRLVAVYLEDYSFALISTIALGAAGGVIFTSFTFVPERWFPVHERQLATALAVQSNYAGWALGCLNPTMLGHKHVSDLKTFLLWLAVVTSFALPLHFVANSRGPRVALNSASPSSSTLSFGATLRLLASRPQYLIHSLCYAILGAVGYAVTGVVDSCFSAALPAVNQSTTDGDGLTTWEMAPDGFEPNQTMGLNAIFVISGVLVGLAVGRLVPDRPAAQAVAVRTLFVLAALSLLGVQILLIAAGNGWIADKGKLYALLLACMCVAGAGTLGFIGIGLRVAVAHSHPAAEIYAGSIIEFWLLAIASALGLLSYVVPPKDTFWFFAIPACVSSCIICTVARFDHQGVAHANTDALLTAHEDGVVHPTTSTKRTEESQR